MNRTSVLGDAVTVVERQTRTLRTVGIGWLLIGALIVLSYNSWVWWQPLNGNPAILRGYLSELAAADQPHHLFFRVGDLVTAFLVLVTAVTGLARVGAAVARRWWAAAYSALTLLAASIAAGAIFPMDCSPSLDRACAAAERAGQVTSAHDLHTLAGVGVEIGLIGALFAAAVALRRTGRIRLSWLLLGMIGIEIVGLSVITGFWGFGVQAIAYPQVVTILNASVACALAAVGQAFPTLQLSARTRRPAPARPRGDR